MALRPVDEVVDQLLGMVQPTRLTQTVTLDAGLNACLAQDIRSPIDVPPADNSAMDGYAIAFDTVSDTLTYEVSDRIAAGHPGKPLKAGTVARIFTGAQIPAGADTVVMQENTSLTEAGLTLLELPDQFDNVRTRGQDISSGTTILKRGDRLTPKALALAASVGVPNLSVYQPLRVAIMSTGDELVEPGSTVAPGQIYNSNRYALAGLLKQMGMVVIDLGIVEDTPQATEQALLQAAASADCILTSGGVSVGEEDHVKSAVEKLGRLDIWKLAIKPGKPLAYGEVDGVPFFGLPGNPVSTYVTFFVVAMPYLLAKQGFSQIGHEVYTASAEFKFKAGGRREYLRVRTRMEGSKLVADKFPNQGSGVMTSVVWANALAEVEPGRQVQPGDPLRIFPLDHY